MIALVKFKKYMTNTNILHIIIDKFGYQLEYGPIVLFKIDKNLKVDLYNTILFFSLAISL